MKIDRRPFYNWIMVLLINIGTILSCFIMGVWNLIPVPLSITIFASVAPILISSSSSKKKNYFGFGVPIILLLPLPYFIWDYYTCTGFLCKLPYFIFSQLFGWSAFIFAIFYIVGIYSKKWSPKIVLFLSFIVPVLLICGVWCSILFLQ
jgi:hypothetical protein